VRGTSLELPSRSHVILRIFNLLGEEVAMLIDEEKEAGRYDVKWKENGFASGIYFYRLQARSRHSQDGQAEEFAETKKLLLLR